MAVVYGIDFGTCYSCLAVAEEGKEIKVQPTRLNNTTLPSVVEFRLKKNGTPRVGTAAKNAISGLSRNVVAFLKTEMDLEESVSEYEVEKSIFRHISPVEFAACIYRELFSYADSQRRNNREPSTNKVVITVPAVCSEMQREKTKIAAEEAGMEVLQVINEPTAAAISYNIDIGETILVFDLGGGTHDVSIVQRTSETDYQVLASVGNHLLGGKNWDEKLIELTYQMAGLSFNPDNVTHPRLIEFERHKIGLCSGDDATITFLDETGIQRQVTIDRDAFEQFTEGLVDQAVKVAKDAVSRAKSNHRTLKIDRICLAGGACRMRAIQRALEAAFPTTPVALNNPDNAIAVGAARYGLSLIQKGADGRYDLHVTERGHAYGLKVISPQQQYVIENFIGVKDPLVVQSQVIHHYMPSTSNCIRLTVFENNVDMPAFRYKGQVPFFSADLQFNKRLTAGTPLDISFNRDANGIVHITVVVDEQVYEFDFATTAGSISDEILQRVRHLMQLMNEAD